MGIAKTRLSTGAAIKSKKGGLGKKDDSNILLARGLSARYCGANIPFTSLTVDEMERDLRHMEAFSNACTAYAQQFYIYQNSAAQVEEEKLHNRKKYAASHAATAAPAQPLIAMPVRIDPEEEKRMTTLRLKIQQCEAQREVLESEYLSLRAHYVYLSQRLKNFRTSVNDRVGFLQQLVTKRAKVLALQRARLQISREVLACLKYRQSGGKTQPAGESKDENDLINIWNKMDEQIKQAEEACREGGIEEWQALKVPKVPPGVPILLSQLAKPPAFAAAWSSGGAFGSKEESLCWLEPEFPEPEHRIRELPPLREEVKLLRSELDKERSRNQELQKGIIARRKRNDELVAMMALLRTETEAVMARHNILLESEIAKDAAARIQEEAQKALAEAATPMATVEEADSVPVAAETAVSGGGANGTMNPTSVDNANDGDDEGGLEEEEEEGDMNGSSEKRALSSEGGGTNGNSPRTKRRKL